jgi:hypothetical protein
MSLGAGVLLSAASFRVASEALMLSGVALTVGGIVFGAATFSIANAALAIAKIASVTGNASHSRRKPRCRAAVPPLCSAPHLTLCRRRWSLGRAEERGPIWHLSLRFRSRTCRTHFPDGRYASRVPLIHLCADPVEQDLSLRGTVSQGEVSCGLVLKSSGRHIDNGDSCSTPL